MSKLNNIVKISEENYRILEDGGSVGGHSYDPSSIYLVEHDYDLYITNDDLNSKCIVKLHQNSDPGEYQIADLNTPACIGWSDDNSGETKSYLAFNTNGNIALNGSNTILIDSNSDNVVITADQLLYNSKEVATVDDLTNYVQTTDSRLSDARTPLSHTHTKSEITDFPSIPTKTSQLTNDSNYVVNTTLNNYIKRGGTSSLFLKADGSVDSNTYVNSNSQIEMIATLSDGTTKTYTIYGKENI